MCAVINKLEPSEKVMKYLLFIVVLLAAAPSVAQQSQELLQGQSVNGFPMLDARRVYSHGEKIKVEEPHGVYTGWILMDDNYFLRPARVTETERKEEPGLAGFFEVNRRIYDPQPVHHGRKWISPTRATTAN